MRRSRSGEHEGEQPGLWAPLAPAGPAPAEPTGPAPDAGLAEALTSVVAEAVDERVVARQCAGYGCDRPVPLRATGRPARWCSPACRQRGWALRAAAAELGRPELAEPRVVREVVERVVVRTLVPATPAPEPAPEPEPDGEGVNDPDDELVDELEAGPDAVGYTRVYVTPPWARRTSPDVPDVMDVPAASPAGPAAGPGPRSGREWAELLDTLTARLHDPHVPVAAEHWHHQRLQAALGRALTALDQAHPGGLRWPRR